MKNFTRARLIENWVVDILREYERLFKEPVPLPIPILDIAEKLFHLKVDFEVFKGRLSNASGIIFPKKRWIILNKKSAMQRANFTLAHELGHWCIDSKDVSFYVNDLATPYPIAGSKPHERELVANYFAGVLTIPKPFLLEEVRKYKSINFRELKELSRLFNVSIRTMQIRLGEISDELAVDGIAINITEVPSSRSLNPIRERSKWKYTIVDLDYSTIDLNLYRKLSEYKEESENLYIIWTEKNAENIASLVEFGCVDGFILPKPTYDDLELNSRSDQDIRYLKLDGCLWSSHLNTTLENNDAALEKAAIFYTRNSDGQLYEQQDLIEIEYFIASPFKLNYRDEAKVFISDAKKAGKRVVIVTGCFDLITNAHVRFLRRAKAVGDILVVGLEDDNRVKKFKGPLRPVNTISQRVELMQAFGFVDFTFVIKGSPNSEIKPFYSRLHRYLKADILAVSDGDPNNQDRKDEIESAGGTLEVVSRYEDGSSTSLIRRFLEKTEFSDLVYVSKPTIINFIADSQNGWHQLNLPFDSSEESSKSK